MPRARLRWTSPNSRAHVHTEAAGLYSNIKSAFNVLQPHQSQQECKPGRPEIRI